MQTNHQLIQTICYGAPHGLQVQYYDGQIVTIDPILREVTEKSIKEHRTTIAHAIFVVEKRHAKLLLHSTSKLTEPILEGGKVPIVELAKMVITDFDGKENYWNTDFIDEVEFIDEYCAKLHYSENHFAFRVYIKEMKMSLFTPQKIEVGSRLKYFGYLIENHFNLFNLSEEYFTEKSTVKL